MRRREFVGMVGGAAAWPIAARVQPAGKYLIGYLASSMPAPKGITATAFRAGLADAGFIEGQNLIIEYRWGNSASSLRLKPLAVDLVQRQVAVLVSVGSHASTFAAKDATSTVPIAFAFDGDPVAYGVVDSLARPGGNATGVAFISNELAGKRLGLLHEMAPHASTVAFLSGTRGYTTYQEQTSTILAAGRELGVRILVIECRSDRDFETAFETMQKEQAGALVVGSFPLGNMQKAVDLAAQRKIPAIYTSGALARAGGLMSYSADVRGGYRQLGAQYVARILKGEKPADLPVQQPTKFELLINRKTADALGIEIPPILLALADEVIE